MLTEEQVEYIQKKGYVLINGHTVTSKQVSEEEIKEFTYLVCKFNLPSIEGIRIGGSYIAIDFKKGYCKDLSELNDMGDSSLISWGSTAEEAMDMAYSKLQ